MKSTLAIVIAGFVTLGCLVGCGDSNNPTRAKGELRILLLDRPTSYDAVNIIADCDWVVEVVVENMAVKKALQIGSQGMSSVLQQKAREIIQSGKLGQITLVRAAAPRASACDLKTTRKSDGCPAAVDAPAGETPDAHHPDPPVGELLARIEQTWHERGVTAAGAPGAFAWAATVAEQMSEHSGRLAANGKRWPPLAQKPSPSFAQPCV